MNHRPKKITPGQPTLFVAVGRGAVRTLRRLPEATSELNVDDVSGPFGFILLSDPQKDPVGSYVDLLPCEQLSQLDTSRFAEDQALGKSLMDPTLKADVARLGRGLRRDQSVGAPAVTPRVSVECYCLIDLDCPESSQAALKLLKTVRTTEQVFDTTVLVLTGRTADSENADSKEWARELKRLAEALEQEDDEPMVHRLYVLDGQDSNGAWLQNEAEMQQMAAEFILHHGLSPYRDHLRRAEEPRAYEVQKLSSICGSFSCRTLRRDSLVMSEGLADELVNRHLSSLGNDVLSAGDGPALSKMANSLAHRWSELACSDSDTTEEAHDALSAALEDVCSERPVPRLRRFLEELQPYLTQIVSAGSRIRRFRRRHQAMKQALKNDESYSRLRNCVGGRFIEWPDPRNPFKVRYQGGPIAYVPKPVSERYYWLGVGILLVATALLVGSHWLWHLAIGVGPLAVLAPIVMGLPGGWIKVQRTPQEPGEPEATGNLVTYRRRTPAPCTMSAAIVLAVAVFSAGLAWPSSVGRLHPADGGASGSLYALLGLAGVLTTAGVIIMLLLSGASSPEDAVRRSEINDISAPPYLPGSIAGGVLAVLGWGGALLFARSIEFSPTTFGFAAIVVSFFLVAVSIALLRWPTTGRTRLTWKTPPRPTPPDGVIKKRYRVARVAAEVDRIIPLCETLLAEVGVRSQRTPAYWPGARPVGCILDAIAGGWRQQLAKRFVEDCADSSNIGAEPTATNPLAKQAESGAKWAECLMDEIANPTIGLGDPARLFAIHAARRWLADRPWNKLVETLDPASHSLEEFVSKCVAPHWPQTQSGQTADASVVVVGPELRDLVGLQVKAARNHRLVLADGNEEGLLTVVRIVQGLDGDWQQWITVSDAEEGSKAPTDGCDHD